ncbi:MAG TPA: efflux RND transporter periplasmic adaptor subunit [Verrucomicrobiae bacterium]|nr:efflux RND transporter periplasmic adaptor subunit [Verrucomicrobiae bacterium]
MADSKNPYLTQRRQGAKASLAFLAALRERFSAVIVLGWACNLGVAADAKPAPEVNVVKATRGEVFRFVTLPGSIRANQQATLYAKVAGYLRSLAVDKGDGVKSGQVLGEIEVPELVADLSRYRAEVRVAEAEFRRVEGASKKSPDLVMPQAVDEALGRLEMARAGLERTETLLAYAKLVAPFDGVVTARFVDPGAFIPAATSGSAAQNAEVLTIMDFDTVRAQVPVPEIEASLVRVGQPVKMTANALPGKTFAGTVSRLAYALDGATQSMLVEADVPNPGRELRPGMYATIRLGVEKHDGVICLPVSALVMEKGGASVFKLVEGKAKKSAVKVGFNDGAMAEITDGVADGEAVLVPTGTALADGQEVRAREAKGP